MHARGDEMQRTLREYVRMSGLCAVPRLVRARLEHTRVISIVPRTAWHPAAAAAMQLQQQQQQRQQQ